MSILSKINVWVYVMKFFIIEDIVMKIRKSILPAVMLTALAFGPTVHATSITYFLDQSNTTINGNQDGVNWGQVTVDDATNVGSLTFTVTLSSLLTSIAGSNFGIDDFGFNTVGAGTPGVFTLPSTQWRSDTTRNEDGFGNFEFTVSTPNGAGGLDRQSPLSFSFLSNGLTLASLAQASTGTAGETNQFFAIHVGGFDSSLVNGDVGNIGSAYFGGSTTRRPPIDPPNAPEPTAVWMLGLGLLGLFGFSRRQAKSALQA